MRPTAEQVVLVEHEDLQDEANHLQTSAGSVLACHYDKVLPKVSQGDSPDNGGRANRMFCNDGDSPDEEGVPTRTASPSLH